MYKTREETVKTWQVITLSLSILIAGFMVSYALMSGGRYQISVSSAGAAVLGSQSGDVFSFVGGHPEYVGSVSDVARSGKQ
jgi:hypothetical protein